jgi:hypothetical protein
MTNLYHLRSGKAGSYRITKLDEDYQIESSYTVSKHECDCPAGTRPTCRHRQMLPFFLAKGHIDNGWMLDWHTRQWRKPLCEDGEATPIGKDFPTGGDIDSMSEEDLAKEFEERVIAPILAKLDQPEAQAQAIDQPEDLASAPAFEIKRGRRI